MRGHIDNEGYISFSRPDQGNHQSRRGKYLRRDEIDGRCCSIRCIPGCRLLLPHVQLGEDVGAGRCAQSGSAASEAELRRFAAARLAYFKVPASSAFWMKSPRAATGKIQRVGMTERLGLRPVDDDRRFQGRISPASTPTAAGNWSRIWGEDPSV